MAKQIKKVEKYRSFFPALLASLAAILFGGIGLYAMGRLPFGPDGHFGFWSGETQSQFNSQRLFDAYSFTHIIHGIGFYFLLSIFARRLPVRYRLIIAVVVEVAWELLENTDMVINRYRAETLSLNYYGDSVLNSMSDMVVALIGFVMAWRWPVWVSILTVAVIEVALAIFIRDNLSLNILLLVYPIEAVKNWQLGI